ncbi:hypothetical protein ADL27_32570 [Streptomyces sp. NRRL F-6602]|nr:hypothetical protein ADL27_32570 [Streptomyces sp. NRRL F-6602]
MTEENTLTAEQQDYADKAYESALTSLLWSESDDEGNSFDWSFDEEDIKGETDTLREQVEAFVSDNWDDLSGMGAEQCGHDFILTRNGHGAGFWDRGLGERGQRLTDSAEPYGEASLYLGDDGSLYLSA